MEASYLAVMLPPFFNNYGKRLVKASKFYFVDPALVCYLSGQPSGETALRGSMRRALFEGLLAVEACKAFANKGQRPNVFHWRAKGELQIDTIIRMKGKYWPVVIKLTATPTARHAQPLNRFRTLTRDDASPSGVLVYRIDNHRQLPGNNIALPWQGFPGWLESNMN